MLEITMEIHVFFYAVWTGCVVYLVYAVMETIRKILKHSLLMISIEDLLYWVFASIYIYYHIFLSTYGVLRWYFFMGIVVGASSAHTIWYGLEKITKKIIKSLEKSSK